VVVGREESVDRAAFLMADHQITHLIVMEEGRPAGIVSALDIGRVLAPEAAPAARPARK
jgi:CBS domain-containing protein